MKTFAIAIFLLMIASFGNALSVGINGATGATGATGAVGATGAGVGTASGALPTYVPVFTGFSSTPTVVASYQTMGRYVCVFVKVTIVGISSSTIHSMSLPVGTPGNSNTAISGPFQVMDNGATLTTAGVAYTDSSSVHAILKKDPAGGVWTNSGNSYFAGSFCYEASTP